MGSQLQFQFHAVALGASSLYALPHAAAGLFLTIAQAWRESAMQQKPSVLYMLDLVCWTSVDLFRHLI